jgi:hypothetical protein
MQIPRLPECRQNASRIDVLAGQAAPSSLPESVGMSGTG